MDQTCSTGKIPSVEKHLPTADTEQKERKMISHLLGELAGLAFPFGLTYLITLVYPLSALIPNNPSSGNAPILINEAITEFVKTNNQIAICLIPSIIYILGRFYFEVVYFTTKFLPIPSAGKKFISSPFFSSIN